MQIDDNLDELVKVVMVFWMQIYAHSWSIHQGLDEFSMSSPNEINTTLMMLKLIMILMD